MNNAYSLALSTIGMMIPKEIIDYTYHKCNAESGGVYSNSDEFIREAIFRGIILQNANVFGGKSKKIIIEPSWAENLKQTRSMATAIIGPYSIFRIPPEAREYADINGAYRVSHWTNANAGTHGRLAPTTRGATAPSVAQTVLESHTGQGSPPRPHVTLLTGDLIKLTPSQHSNIRWILDCRIGYDKEFNNLHNQGIFAFKEVAVLATKMYIYNALVIQLDRGHIEAGYELGAFKEIVSSYADLEDKYEEKLKSFAGAVMTDPERVRNALSYML